MTRFLCRTATLPEVEQILDWAADEGWNPGRDDAAAFYAADPQGFFVAEVDRQPVAAISVVNHSESYAFLGLYLCRPEFREQGIGFALWQHAIVHAGGRTVGLDGVPAQEANYAKSGFVLADRTRRLTGTFPTEALTLPLAAQADFAALACLDRAATGVSRERYLGTWLRNGPTRRTVLLREGANVIGFATARLCRVGVKIGPIVAPDAAAALHLAHQAAATMAEPLAIIDVPDRCAAFGALLRQNGFVEGFATARMYRGLGPDIGDTLHAVATLELG
ncbi:GNAT family N-acetyltransferase [Roseovarius sp.]|uniref:GNAT family N-acetyltransferase n=1 Tax=Roseovarius sp. TaxID=1486281 RepID=UPI001B4B9BF0|nr:GNAT family N-acetyltransferase [Roseovarius sp.]MBQ0808987.1 GNAT family N-acetyltransferase [Roseovarius sp.]